MPETLGVQLLATLNIDPRSRQKLNKMLNSVGRGSRQALNFTRATSQVANQINAIGNAAKANTGPVSKFLTMVEGKIRSYSGYAIASSYVLGFGLAFKRAAQFAALYERELVRIAQVTRTSTQSIRAHQKSLIDLSTTYNISLKELAKVVRILTQTGISFSEALKAAEALSKTTLLATFESLEDTTEGLISAMQTFNLTAVQAAKVLEDINVLAKRFAVESADLVTAIRKAGGPIVAVGGNIRDLLALMIAVRSTTRESADTIATGFRTIFGRLQRPTTLAYLKQLGVELTNLEGEFIGPTRAILEISKAIEKLGIGTGNVKLGKLVEVLGGIRQFSKVVPLLTQTKKIEEALRLMGRSGEESSEDIAKAQDTLIYQFGQLEKKFDAFVNKLVQGGPFSDMIKVVLRLGDAFLRLADIIVNSPLMTLAQVWAAFKLPIGIEKIASRGLNFMLNMGHSEQTNDKNIPAFAKGGPVPGTGNKDNVLAWLMPGEYVLPKDVVRKLGGASNIRKMLGRSSGNVPDLKGGSIPVMLTPGEFVLSKDDVSRIGKDKLDKLIAAAKARKIRHFASGGSVDDVSGKQPQGRRRRLSKTYNEEIYALINSLQPLAQIISDLKHVLSQTSKKIGDDQFAEQTVQSMLLYVNNVIFDFGRLLKNVLSNPNLEKSGKDFVSALASAATAVLSLDKSVRILLERLGYANGSIETLFKENDQLVKSVNDLKVTFLELRKSLFGGQPHPYKPGDPDRLHHYIGAELLTVFTGYKINQAFPNAASSDILSAIRKILFDIQNEEYTTDDGNTKKISTIISDALIQMSTENEEGINRFKEVLSHAAERMYKILAEQGKIQELERSGISFFQDIAKAHAEKRNVKKEVIDVHVNKIAEEYNKSISENMEDIRTKISNFITALNELGNTVSQNFENIDQLVGSLGQLSQNVDILSSNAKILYALLNRVNKLFIELGNAKLAERLKLTTIRYSSSLSEAYDKLPKQARQLLGFRLFSFDNLANVMRATDVSNTESINNIIRLLLNNLPTILQSVSQRAANVSNKNDLASLLSDIEATENKISEYVDKYVSQNENVKQVFESIVSAIKVAAQSGYLTSTNRPTASLYNFNDIKSDIFKFAEMAASAIVDSTAVRTDTPKVVSSSSSNKQIESASEEQKVTSASFAGSNNMLAALHEFMTSQKHTGSVKFRYSDFITGLKKSLPSVFRFSEFSDPNVQNLPNEPGRVFSTGAIQESLSQIFEIIGSELYNRVQQAIASQDSEEMTKVVTQISDSIGTYIADIYNNAFDTISHALDKNNVDLTTININMETQVEKYNKLAESFTKLFIGFNAAIFAMSKSFSNSAEFIKESLDEFKRGFLSGIKKVIDHVTAKLGVENVEELTSEQRKKMIFAINAMWGTFRSAFIEASKSLDQREQLRALFGVYSTITREYVRLVNTYLYNILNEQMENIRAIPGAGQHIKHLAEIHELKESARKKQKTGEELTDEEKQAMQARGIQYYPSVSNSFLRNINKFVVGEQKKATSRSEEELSAATSLFREYNVDQLQLLKPYAKQQTYPHIIDVTPVQTSSTPVSEEEKVQPETPSSQPPLKELPSPRETSKPETPAPKSRTYQEARKQDTEQKEPVIEEKRPQQKPINVDITNLKSLEDYLRNILSRLDEITNILKTVKSTGIPLVSGNVPVFYQTESPTPPLADKVQEATEQEEEQAETIQKKTKGKRDKRKPRRSIPKSLPPIGSVTYVNMYKGTYKKALQKYGEEFVPIQRSITEEVESQGPNISDAVEKLLEAAKNLGDIDLKEMNESEHTVFNKVINDLNRSIQEFGLGNAIQKHENTISILAKHVIKQVSDVLSGIKGLKESRKNELMQDISSSIISQIAFTATGDVAEGLFAFADKFQKSGDKSIQSAISALNETIKSSIETFVENMPKRVEHQRSPTETIYVEVESGKEVQDVDEALITPSLFGVPVGKGKYIREGEEQPQKQQEKDKESEQQQQSQETIIKVSMDTLINSLEQLKLIFSDMFQAYDLSTRNKLFVQEGATYRYNVAGGIYHAMNQLLNLSRVLLSRAQTQQVLEGNAGAQALPPDVIKSLLLMLRKVFKVINDFGSRFEHLIFLAGPRIYTERGPFRAEGILKQIHIIASQLKHGMIVSDIKNIPKELGGYDNIVDALDALHKNLDRFIVTVDAWSSESDVISEQTAFEEQLDYMKGLFVLYETLAREDQSKDRDKKLEKLLAIIRQALSYDITKEDQKTQFKQYVDTVSERLGLHKEGLQSTGYVRVVQFEHNPQLETRSQMMPKYETERVKFFDIAKGRRRKSLQTIKEAYEAGQRIAPKEQETESENKIEINEETANKFSTALNNFASALPDDSPFKDLVSQVADIGIMLRSAARGDTPTSASIRGLLEKQDVNKELFEFMQKIETGDVKEEDFEKLMKAIIHPSRVANADRPTGYEVQLKQILNKLYTALANASSEEEARQISTAISKYEDIISLVMTRERYAVGRMFYNYVSKEELQKSKYRSPQLYKKSILYDRLDAISLDVNESTMHTIIKTADMAADALNALAGVGTTSHVKRTLIPSEVLEQIKKAQQEQEALSKEEARKKEKEATKRAKGKKQQGKKQSTPESTTATQSPPSMHPPTGGGIPVNLVSTAEPLRVYVVGGKLEQLDKVDNVTLAQKQEINLCAQSIESITQPLKEVIRGIGRLSKIFTQGKATVKIKSVSEASVDDAIYGKTRSSTSIRGRGRRIRRLPISEEARAALGQYASQFKISQLLERGEGEREKIFDVLGGKDIDARDISKILYSALQRKTQESFAAMQNAMHNPAMNLEGIVGEFERLAKDLGLEALDEDDVLHPSRLVQGIIEDSVSQYARVLANIRQSNVSIATKMKKLYKFMGTRGIEAVDLDTLISSTEDIVKSAFDSKIQEAINKGQTSIDNIKKIQKEVIEEYRSALESQFGPLNINIGDILSDDVFKIGNKQKTAIASAALSKIQRRLTGLRTGTNIERGQVENFLGSVGAEFTNISKVYGGIAKVPQRIQKTLLDSITQAVSTYAGAGKLPSDVMKIIEASINKLKSLGLTNAQAMEAITPAIESYKNAEISILKDLLKSVEDSQNPLDEISRIIPQIDGTIQNLQQFTVDGKRAFSDEEIQQSVGSIYTDAVLSAVDQAISQIDLSEQINKNLRQLRTTGTGVEQFQEILTPLRAIREQISSIQNLPEDIRNQALQKIDDAISTQVDTYRQQATKQLIARIQSAERGGDFSESISSLMQYINQLRTLHSGDLSALSSSDQNKIVSLLTNLVRDRNIRTGGNAEEVDQFVSDVLLSLGYSIEEAATIVHNTIRQAADDLRTDFDKLHRAFIKNISNIEGFDVTNIRRAIEEYENQLHNAGASVEMINRSLQDARNDIVRYKRGELAAAGSKQLIRSMNQLQLSGFNLNELYDSLTSIRSNILESLESVGIDREQATTHADRIYSDVISRNAKLIVRNIISELRARQRTLTPESRPEEYTNLIMDAANAVRFLATNSNIGLINISETQKRDIVNIISEAVSGRELDQAIIENAQDAFRFLGYRAEVASQQASRSQASGTQQTNVDESTRDAVRFEISRIFEGYNRRQDITELTSSLSEYLNTIRNQYGHMPEIRSEIGRAEKLYSDIQSDILTDVTRNITNTNDIDAIIQELSRIAQLIAAGNKDAENLLSGILSNTRIYQDIQNTLDESGQVNTSILRDLLSTIERRRAAVITNLEANIPSESIRSEYVGELSQTTRNVSTEVLRRYVAGIISASDNFEDSLNELNDTIGDFGALFEGEPGASDEDKTQAKIDALRDALVGSIQTLVEQGRQREVYQAIGKGLRLDKLIDSLADKLNIDRATVELQKLRMDLFNNIRHDAPRYSMGSGRLMQQISRFSMRLMAFAPTLERMGIIPNNLASREATAKGLSQIQGIHGVISTINQLLANQSERISKAVSKASGGLSGVGARLVEKGAAISGKGGRVAGVAGGSVRILGKTLSFLGRILPKLVTISMKLLSAFGAFLSGFSLVGSILDTITAVDYKKIKETAIKTGDVASAEVAARREVTQSIARSIPFFGQLVLGITELSGNIDGLGRYFQQFKSNTYALVTAITRVEAALSLMEEQTTLLTNRFENLANTAGLDAYKELQKEFVKILSGTAQEIKSGSTAFNKINLSEDYGIFSVIFFSYSTYSERIKHASQTLIRSFESLGNTIENLTNKRLSLLDSKIQRMAESGTYSPEKIRKIYTREIENIFNGPEVKSLFDALGPEGIKGYIAYSNIITDATHGKIDYKEAAKRMGALAERKREERKTKEKALAEFEGQTHLGRKFSAALLSSFLIEGWKRESLAIEQEIERRKVEIAKAREAEKAFENARVRLEKIAILEKWYENVAASAKQFAKLLQAINRINASIFTLLRTFDRASISLDLVAQTFGELSQSITPAAFFERYNLGITYKAASLDTKTLITDEAAKKQYLSFLKRMSPDVESAKYMEKMFEGVTNVKSHINRLLTGKVKRGDETIPIIDAILKTVTSTDRKIATREKVELAIANLESVRGEKLSEADRTALTLALNTFFDNLGDDVRNFDKAMDAALNSAAEHLEKTGAKELLNKIKELAQKEQERYNKELQLVNMRISYLQNVMSAERTYIDSLASIVRERREFFLVELQGVQELKRKFKLGMANIRDIRFKREREAGTYKEQLYRNKFISAQDLKKTDKELTAALIDRMRALRQKLSLRALATRFKIGGLKPGETLESGFSAAAILSKQQSPELMADIETMKQILGTLKEHLNRKKELIQDEIEQLKSMAEAQRAYVQSVRDTQGDMIAEFTFGSGQDRASMLRGIFATQIAMQTGTVDVLPGEMRKQVESLLDKFSNISLPQFGGKTGAELKGELAANTMRRMYALTGRKMTQAEWQDIANKVAKKQIPIDERLEKVIKSKYDELAKVVQDQFAVEKELNELERASIDTFANSVNLFGAIIEDLKRSIRNGPQPQPGVPQASNMPAGKEAPEYTSIPSLPKPNEKPEPKPVAHEVTVRGNQVVEVNIPNLPNIVQQNVSAAVYAAISQTFNNIASKVQNAQNFEDVSKAFKQSSIEINIS